MDCPLVSFEITIHASIGFKLHRSAIDDLFISSMWDEIWHKFLRKFGSDPGAMLVNRLS